VQVQVDKKANRRLSGLLGGLLAIIVTAGPGNKPAQAQVWNGSVSNQWNNPLNWTPNTVPNSSTAGAVIDVATGAVLISGINPTVGNLTLAGGLNLSIENGQSLSINANGVISNTGTITINSSGSGTLLYVGNGGTTTLDGGGGGVVDMTSSSANQLYGDGNVILDNVNNTIQGQGCIGCGHGMALQNAGIVNANVASATLTLDGNTTVNTGTLEATSGGELQIENSVNNVGGMISTDSGKGSLVLVNGSQTISGGAVSGNIQLAGGATLNGVSNTVTNSGTVTVTNGQSGQILGTINNTGSIQISSAGSGTYLYVGNNGNGTTKLTGGGTVTLSDTAHNGAAVIYGDNGQVLENFDNTIEGEGQIGNSHGLAVLNDASGIINANSSGQILDLNGSNGVTNNGTLEATTGGILRIDNTVANGGGTIKTDSGMGSEVLLNGATIQGGTLSGNVESENGSLVDGSTAQGQVNNQGTLTVLNNSTMTIHGTINNTGAIVLAGQGNGTNLYVGNNSTGTTTLTGGGTLTLQNSDHNNATVIYGDNNQLLENVNNTIEGEGQIGAGHGMLLQNDASGVVNANVSGQTLYLNGTGVTNNGLLTATNGGTLEIYNQTVINGTGMITTDSGNGSAVLLNAATIQGGTLNGNIQTEGGTLLDGSTAQGQINNQGTVTVLNNNQTDIHGTINNTGLILLAGQGNGTYLYAGNNSAGTTTLTGGGTLTLQNSDHNGATGIYGDNNQVLENVNNTIQGEGSIGFGHGMQFLNDAAGLVNANVNGQTLTIQTPGGTTNANILEATNGGTLEIYATTVNNGNGTIKTDSVAGSAVLLDNSTVQGGTLTGNIQTENGTLLDGRSSVQGTLTNGGMVTALNNNTLYILGTINNTGTILLNGAGNGTYLYAGNNSAGTTTLTGGGIITLANSDHNGATGIYGDNGQVLENVNNTIQGEGSIGFGHGFQFLNDAAGLVNANVNGQTLTIDTASGTTNANILEATKGGTLEIYATTVNNGSGTIKTDSGMGSTVILNNSTIQGGTLNGTVTAENSTLLDGRTSVQGTLNNQGAITTPNNNTLYILGTINNTGSILLAGQGNGTYLYVGNNGTGEGTTKLTGNGTITLANSDHNGATGIYGDNGQVFENAGNTIQGEGHIGFGHGMQFLNDAGGTVLANVTGQTLYVDPSEGSTNNGTFKASNGGTLLVSTGLTNWNGATNTLTGGTYVINGTAHPSTLQINSLGTGGGEITTIGAGTTLTLNGTNPNVSFVDASGDNALTNLINNQGNLNLEGGYSLTYSGTFTNSGDVLIDPASIMIAGVNNINPGYLQTAGITQVDGTLLDPFVFIGGGVLEGDGAVGSGGVVTIASGAAIQAGDTLTAPTDPPGTLNFPSESLDLNTGSTVNETISGAALADISLLNVVGNVNTGTSEGVDVMLLNGFNPTTASQFVFLDYTGTLSAQTFFVTDPHADPFGTFGIGYGLNGGNNAYLTFTPNTTSPVPEPATFLPLAGLLAFLAYGIRRRKQSKQAA
jgi:fibronectin-binding autotransporter adhesin